MARIVPISKARSKKARSGERQVRHEGFQPCSPDMTICGDCQDNRSKSKCPRLKEWIERRRS